MATNTLPTFPSEGALRLPQIDEMQKAFEADPRHRQAMNAVCVTPVGKVAQSRRATTLVDHTFSHQLPEGKATAQKSSGRCWLFAALNTFRMAAIKSMNLSDDFELSQSYTMFWDQLEKANYFLESVLATLDEPVGSRLFDWVVGHPTSDAGQWHMLVNVVRKYGVVPKRVMPETESSSSTGQMNYQLVYQLREYACRLRQAHAAGASVDDLRAMKPEMLEVIYRMLCIHLGEPPREFAWQWRDKDKQFHREAVMTPQEFYQRHVAVDLDDLICLIHCPQPAKRYNALYTIKFLGNVVGGEIIKYLNVELDVMKRAAIEQIKDGSPVWFGCDVGKHLDRDLGVLDLDLFDYGLVYGLAPEMTKAERLDYGHSVMTHAMVFTGVDLDDEGKPRKWRVENSWGDQGGDKGFLLMTNAWFDEYNYEVVVHRQYVPPELLPLLDTEPIALEPWDPMGALA